MRYFWNMLLSHFPKYIRLLILLIPLLGAIQLLAAQEEVQEKTQEKTKENLSAEKINLALRRTADRLLRDSGDSTSRIPAIEQAGEQVWRVRLDQPFNYAQLPAQLQSSFELYEIKTPYEVTIRNCRDATIDLGYHQTDFLEDNRVACQGREMPEGCHYIEITFLKSEAIRSSWMSKLWTLPKLWILPLILSGLAGLWLFRRKKILKADIVESGVTDWLEFGNSKLDVKGQKLICGNSTQKLTYRETKLLSLFATNPDKLLERDSILQQVWADEGVLVGRSLDVFVSRLRKKLAADPTIGIVAVHGVGYRLETGINNQTL